jgi:murein DD-endopeptidase MepM/ murein hydrolase activator NlpD
VRARTAIAAGLAVAALLAGLLAPASADDLDDVQDKIEATEDALHGASQRLKAAAADLANAEAKLPAARAAYAAAQERLQRARELLAQIRHELRQLRAQQEKVQAEIEAAQVRIERSETLIGRIVRVMYQTGGYAELQVVLEAESPTDFVQRVMATQSVTEAQAAVIDQLNADKAVLAAREQIMQVTEEAIEAKELEAEKQLETQKGLAAEAKEAKQTVVALVQARQKALAVAEEERDKEEQRLANLEAQRDAIQAAIAQSSSVGTATGSLIWPMPGYSAGTGGVGWRVHPVYGYRSCHTGVDISAPEGTQIIAARGGRVIWANGNSAPYGNNTLIDHGNGLATFYAHQSSFAVTAGERVAKGEVIGYVGSTGYSSGPHLHFEVHVNGEPHDPLGWFGGSKTPKSEFCP